MNRDAALVGSILPEGREPNHFGSLRVPPMMELNVGPWSLTRTQHVPPVKIRGYFTPGYQSMAENWTLIHTSARSAHKQTTWMSITPMELESQAHHAASAVGHVLIGGLGMGLLAWNVAQLGTVHKVTVVERDPSVIGLVSTLAAQCSWDNWSKVNIVQADMLTYRNEPDHGWAGANVDVVLLDIWPTVGDVRLRPELQLVSNHVLARQYAAWGLEMDFVSWLSENGIRPRDIKPEHWQAYSLSIGVPLIMYHDPRMAKLAFQSVVNGLKHEADKLMGGRR